MKPLPDRAGLLGGGNFIVDTVVRIDRFPREDMLANILDESRSNGGGPYNVLRNLAALGADFPLGAIGMVGDDENGAWIKNDLRAHGIAADQLHTTATAATSHTQVMTVQSSGRRTFFHHRGANGLLSPRHFDFNRPPRARLFHLGYLMLLDTLDAVDTTGRTGASRVLEAAYDAGLCTSVDLVSVEHPDFGARVRPSLPWVDHLIINEVEAGRLLQRDLPAGTLSDLAAAAAAILDLGVRQAVVIHTVAGGVFTSRHDGTHALGSLQLPEEWCVGTNGAGDAFAAGYLYGLHEGWSVDSRLQLAVCAAAASLADPSPSGGLGSVDESLALGRRFAPRPWIGDLVDRS